MGMKLFGILPDHREVYKYQIENEYLRAEVSAFGCVLLSLKLKEKNNLDVVLGYKDLDAYLTNKGNLGAVIAPNANRTEGASFTMDGISYPLEKNNGENNLHSSVLYGAQKQLWKLIELGDNYVVLQLKLSHLENGFPGERLLNVTYYLEEKSLLLKYDMVSDRKTVFNPTNHTYFNLNGHNSGTVLNHTAVMNCSYFTPVKQGAITTGEIRSVEGTVFDFRKGKRISEGYDPQDEQMILSHGIDHNLVIDGYDGTFRYFGKVTSDITKITMKCYTDLPGVQFYTGNYLGCPLGKEGADYKPQMGLCLETQYFPNCLVRPEFAKPFIEKDKWASTMTRYEFEY